MKTLSANTIAALEAAPVKGIVKRDFVWMKAENRTTGDIEYIGVCSEHMAVTVPVVRPSDGATIVREYQPNPGLMLIPAIPASLKLEERRLRLSFSRLSPAIINAVRVFNIKNQPIEIHRGFYDPDTMNLVDPCHCRFDGFVRAVDIKKPKPGGTGEITLELVDHSASLMPNPIKISKAFFLGRDGDRGGDHIGARPKIAWGQELVVKERKGRKKVKLWG